jgi:hypothetical protein
VMLHLRCICNIVRKDNIRERLYYPELQIRLR